MKQWLPQKIWQQQVQNVAHLTGNFTGRKSGADVILLPLGDLIDTTSVCKERRLSAFRQTLATHLQRIRPKLVSLGASI